MKMEKIMQNVRDSAACTIYAKFDRWNVSNIFVTHAIGNFALSGTVLFEVRRLMLTELLWISKRSHENLKIFVRHFKLRSR